MMRAAQRALLGCGLFLYAASAWGRAPEPVSPDLSQPEERAQAQLDVLEGLVEAGMIDNALEVAAQLRGSGMKDTRLDLLQARAMQGKGMTDQAVSMLRTVTRKEPRNAAAWSELGVVLSDAQDADGAISALERARRLTPNDARVLNNLGYLTMAKGQNQLAVELFQASLVQDPSNARTRNNLGFALARLERDTEALTTFRTAGTEADARYNMGVACELRGDTASALTNYQAAVALSTQSPAAAALTRLLHPESP